jgi:K+-sensing histidine kinase KdpD
MTESVRTSLWLLAGVIAPVAVAVACIPLEGSMSAASVALVLVVPVVAVAVSGRRSAAVLAAVAAAAAFDFIYTEPRRSLAVADANDVILIATLLVVGVAVAQMASWALRERTTADRMTSDVAILRSVAELISMGEDQEIVAMTSAYWLRELLQLRDCRLAKVDDPTSPARISTTGEVLVGHLRWAPEHQGLPGPEIDLPLHREGVVVGRFILQPTVGVAVQPDRLFTAAALADLVGSARTDGSSHPRSTS